MMKLNEFKKLEESVSQQDFSKSFSNINKVMFCLSIFGHVVSIFLAYFLVSKILSGAIIDNPILVAISSVILLGGLELLKREIFDKFSLQQIKHKKISHKDVLPLFLVSLIIVSVSFYASIHGAKEFSTRSNQIEIALKTNRKKFEDSVSVQYSKKISEVESHRGGLIDMQTKLQSTIVDSRITKQQEKLRKDLEVQIGQDDKKIMSLGEEMKLVIRENSEIVSKEGQSKKDENQSNSFFFVVISTLVELVILIGVYFNEYYKYRSYVEIKERIDTDPNYQRWFRCEILLDVIYTPDTKMNDKIPSFRTIIDLCKINGLSLLQKDVADLFKLFSTLGIIRGTSTKYINKSKDNAREIVKKHLNIE